MMTDKFIYYLAFPIVVVGLCVYSYFLGYNKGKHRETATVVQVEPVKSKESHKLPAQDLTFFKELQPKDSSATSEKKRWIQVSAFQELGKAHELLDRLKNQGFPAQVNSDKSNKGWHRVVVGPYKSIRNAEEGINSLQEKGFGKGFFIEL